jgi:acyl transferase domain-containing protein/aryl carrier-like protein
MGVIEPVAIIGIGCRLPGGVQHPDDLWTLLANGVDAIGEVPADRWLLSSMYHPDVSKPGRINSRYGGFLDHIDRFDAQFFGISPREAAPADPQQRLLLELAYHAIEDAGLTLSFLSGRQAGVFVGIASFDYGSLQFNDRATIDAYTNLGGALCIAANRISYFFNLLGPSVAIDTACSSSLVATHFACESIWKGESELAFAGGVNVILRPELSIGFSKASMLAPDGRCKSFDARANGYVRGEGAGVVILKPLSRAVADGDRIYALIRATAVNQDGRTEGISVPNRLSQEANLRSALTLAGIAAESVQYVEAHGTGTPVGDPIEAAALGAVYGQARKPDERCVIGSIKSNVGHLEAGAGIIGLIKTALCLHHRQIPPSLHFETPNPQIRFDDLRLRVAQRLEPWPESNGHPPRAGVNSFGFGGTNGHAILEAAPEFNGNAAPSPHPTEDDRAWMLPLSARSASALSDLARLYANALDDGGRLRDAALRDISFSASLKRSHHEFRLAVVGRDKPDLVEQLQAFLRGEERSNTSNGRIAEKASRPVFVCSGMGQQWWGMGRELLQQERAYRDALEEVDALFRQLAGWSLLEEMNADADRSQMGKTQVAQPALFAVQVALAALWRSWGVEPAAVVGHSAGEVAAAYIAGALSLRDAACVAYHRSRLQQRTAGQGTMLAAAISREEAARLIARHAQAISIGAVNGARSLTLSGDASVLAQIEAALNEANVFCRPLQVEVPFHSPIMEQLETELMQSLRDIEPRAATTAFFSTVTGAALNGPELDARYWYRNIREPVLFHAAIAEMIAAGHELFVEIGSHPILRNDIAACLNERSIRRRPVWSLKRGEAERAAMLGALGRLYADGAQIDWHKLFAAGGRVVKLPSHPFQRDRHWRESERVRQIRVGHVVHPLLGKRLETAQPIWNATLDATDSTYLTDHRIGKTIVFPGAGYVEMALAAGREIFGSVPCMVQDIEFQKFLVLDEKKPCLVQIAFDAAASAFDIHGCADSSAHAWELHARGSMRRAEAGPPPTVDVAQIRRRCRDAVDVQEYYARLSEIGLDYGPAFQGIARLWRGADEILADICMRDAIRQGASSYRLHPAVLDASFQAVMAALPASFQQNAAKATYLPVRIERIRFQTSPDHRVVAVARLSELGPAELKADIDILNDAGELLVEVQGLVCRPIERRARPRQAAFYEYQWKLARGASRTGWRDSRHLAFPGLLAPVLQAEAEGLRQRFDRARFQGEFLPLSRKAAALHIARALRELGYTPQCAAMPVDELADHLGLAPQYRKWLRLMLSKEVSPAELTSSEDPHRPWKEAWDAFPECQIEMLLARRCGEELARVLRGEVDPLNLIFPEGELTTAEHLYQDSPTFRLNNLLVQKAVMQIVQHLPKGKALRVLEIGGGTGGMTSFVLSVLPEHCTEYVFTDISALFIAHAQRKFARYPFVQYRPLDIERDPAEQGFEAHSFDLIIASDVLHATQNLPRTLDRMKHLLGSGGTLILLEPTRPGLGMTLIFGLLKGWWLFEDDGIRCDEPCINQEKWKGLLTEAGFSAPLCIADCPDAEHAQHSVIIARAPELALSPALAPQGAAPPDTDEGTKIWIVFAEAGTGARPSVGAALANELREHGGRIVVVKRGDEFQRCARDAYTCRPGKPNDMRRLLDAIGRESLHLAGIIHLWSLDADISEQASADDWVSSARVGCVGALHLIQALATTDGLAVDGLWLVTRAAQPLAGSEELENVMQSPLWGALRVAINEYKNLRCRLIDLATGSAEEVAQLADELQSLENSEDEIALHGELRYVRRLVSMSAVRGGGQPARTVPFRMQLRRPGIIESLAACRMVRRPPMAGEVEVEIAATGLNFKDLMLCMGMLPREAMAFDSAGAPLLGLECAGRIVAVGNEVSGFAIGDEVVVGVAGSLATHVTVDQRLVARKPPQLSLEQAATIPVAFMTALYALHTLGNMRRGERVLIHAGSGGVGLAAVQLALNAGAIVFATAGSPEKRGLLSALGVHHVLDSRTLAFADDILKLTNGKGVDLVLNSLGGEAIDKSLSILHPYGRFIEIGLRDIYQNRKMGMRLLRKNIAFFAVDLSRVFEQRAHLPRSLLDQAMRQVAEHKLSALPHRTFPIWRIAEALRYMAQAKHVGKLIVSMQDTEGLPLERDAAPTAIDPAASYLITGGLGGFGLALAARLARRGARHLLLVGRSAPSTAAQSAVAAIRRQGVEVGICQADVTDRGQTQRALDIARSMAPVRGIMHAAMVLDDAPIERLTEERMWKAMGPKLLGSWNLHALTAEDALDFFVMFSSFTSMIGNPGQANYVAGNAFLDALAYYRRARGLPALTVNWGMVGEVGHVASSPDISQRLDRLGASMMPLSDTLDALEELMSSAAVQVGVAQLEWKGLLRLMPSPVPARFAAFAGEIAEEAHSGESSRVHEILEAEAAALPALLEGYLREHLARAMGASPARIDAQQSLLSLGLDSLIALELRNRINADFGINVSLAKIMQSASLGAFAASIAVQLRSEEAKDHAAPDIATRSNGGTILRADGDPEAAEHERDTPVIKPYVERGAQPSAAHTPAK